MFVFMLVVVQSITVSVLAAVSMIVFMKMNMLLPVSMSVLVYISMFVFVLVCVPVEVGLLSAGSVLYRGDDAVEVSAERALIVVRKAAEQIAGP
jgi:hypothetical protein